MSTPPNSDPPADVGTTTVQNALNILEASLVQREAVEKAFEAQRSAVSEAVSAQKAAAMQQLAEARKTISAQEADKQMSAAQHATQSLANVTRKVFNQKPGADKDPAMGEMNASANAVNQTAVPSEHEALISALKVLEDHATLSGRTTQSLGAPAETDIVEQITDTLKTIIAQEIQDQLTALTKAAQSEMAAAEEKEKK